MRVLRENGSKATAQNVHKVRRPAEARRAGALLPVIVKFLLLAILPVPVYEAPQCEEAKHTREECECIEKQWIISNGQQLLLIPESYFL